MTSVSRLLEKQWLICVIFFVFCIFTAAARTRARCVLTFDSCSYHSFAHTHISAIFTFKCNTFPLIIFHKSIDNDIKSQIKSNVMMFWRYMSCDEGYGPVNKEEKLSTQRKLWEKKVLCPSQDRLKEQWQKHQSGTNQKPKKTKNCSIQHGDDCQTETDSYLDSFFVPLITQTVLRDSGRVPRVMTDSVLWEGGIVNIYILNVLKQICFISESVKAAKILRVKLPIHRLVFVFCFFVLFYVTFTKRKEKLLS